MQSISIIVKDYMDTNPLAIKHTTNIHNVVEVLLKRGVSGAPVIDADKKVIGFVSEQDCLKEILNEAFFCEDPIMVTDVMHKEVLSVTPDTGIIELAQTLLSTKPKIYPVIATDGKLLGTITRSHILTALLENTKETHSRW